ncbi:MAG: DUF4468 domain-containing protein [Bacteroidetes bacterium]|nr:DUF4468 domain-containing protein [Bacteroidota bacterium]
MRTCLLALLLLQVRAGAMAQDATDAAGTLVITDAIGLELSKARIYAAALDAWGFTFGQEPGARLDREDKENGVIEGAARFNYRSTALSAREETMGTIAYRITVQCDNGQCRVRVAQLVHTGNRGAMGGGIDLGPIYAGDRPMTRVPGISLGLAQRLHADMRDRSSERIGQVMKAFAARLRAAAAP